MCLHATDVASVESYNNHVSAFQNIQLYFMQINWFYLTYFPEFRPKTSVIHLPCKVTSVVR